MKTMKSGVILLSVLLIFVLLTACGGNEGQPASSEAPSEKPSSQEGSDEPKKEPASSFPEKEITFIVHSKAGSSTDVMARIAAKAAEKHLGQSIVIVNKDNAAEAAAQLMNAPTDGYTISTQTRSMLGNFATNRDPYPFEDYQFISRLVMEPFVIAVHTDSPYQTIEDLLDYTKKNPGELSMSTYKAGSTHQISAILFNKSAGIDVKLIPFNSGSEIVTTLLGKNVDIAHTNPGIAKQYVESGDIRVLAISDSERSEDYPNAPTYKELGYDLEEIHWRGIIGKKGIPDDVLEIISTAFENATQEPEFQEYANNNGLMIKYMGPKELTKASASELEVIKETVKEIGLVK